MTFEPMHVANSMLSRAFRDNRHVSPMRLQRLLWFTACEYARTAGAPLTAEQFEVWPYGPVLRSLHGKFKCFGAGPIDTYAKDAAGTGHAVDVEHHPLLAAALDAVWEKASPYSPRTLSEISTWPGSAWFAANEAGERTISNDRIAADTSYISMLKPDAPLQPAVSRRTWTWRKLFRRR